ncbi:hypothetical protein, partial [Mesorhizobium sp. M2E.F.Ca.ET.209.01.1.1]|uniref:hypothetical protein n=1 Tax=Mesorhizobium sp. M2E.F.Ca.ET.209.01.1.1 TaxID=2500526 RepID=UPI001FEE97B0
AQATHAEQPPTQGLRGHQQLASDPIEAVNQSFFGQMRPIAEPVQNGRRHQQSGRKIIGQLLDAVAPYRPCLLDVLGRHLLPRQDVEELMGKIEMPSAG